MNYNEEIRRLEDQIAALTKEIENLKARRLKFEFTDAQLYQAAIELLRAKTFEDDWDMDYIDDQKENIWTLEQLNAFKEIESDEEANDVLRDFLNQTRRVIEEIISDLEEMWG